MTFFSQITKKVPLAMENLLRCFGEKGVWADPTRYAEQCWTRDFSMAIQPLLLALGEREIARTHLNSLRDLQRPNGQIPILFLDNEERWLKIKEEKSAANGRESFMLRRYREGELWNLTPGTTDSELHYLLAVFDHFPGGDWSKEYMSEFHPSVLRAYDYVEKNLIKDGLFVGCDWRDTMQEHYCTTPLLVNNCLWYRVCRKANELDKAERLKKKINKSFAFEGALTDFPGASRFDPLGLAFAVLNEVVDPESYPAILRAFESVDSPCGMTIKCRHNPLDADEARVIEETDGEVAWPFVVGFVILALIKMDQYGAARAQLDKLTALEGFREYYDPRTGKGYGAAEQLWSAVLYLRAFFKVMGLN